MIEGIDVSHYEKVNNWTLVKQNESFVFTKATQGIGFVDPTFRNYWTLLAQSSIPRGAYHVIDMKYDPVEQAEFFLETVGELKSSDMLALDWEQSVNKDVEGGALACMSFLEHISGKTTALPFFYGSYFETLSMRFPTEAEKFPLWLARYGVRDPGSPAPWAKWTIWQYTDSGKTLGVGNCDQNFFNGSKEDFNKFIGI